MKFFHLFSRSTWQITLFRFKQRKLRRLRPAAKYTRCGEIIAIFK